MKHNHEFPVIEDAPQEAADFSAAEFCQSYFDKYSLKMEADKTQNLTSIPSGEWRTNIMLEDSASHRAQRVLSLRHLTSFEEKSMEDHGKTLRKTLQNYLKTVRPSCPDQELGKKKPKEYEGWGEVYQALSLIENLEQFKKISLSNFARRNVEAQLLLTQIFNNIPEDYLPDCLSIALEIFQQFEAEEVYSMDEDEIETYVSLNSGKFSENLRRVLAQSQLLSSNPEEEQKFLEMVGVWMQTIFLALNGVFESPQDRKTPFGELEGFDTFYTARKLVKID